MIGQAGLFWESSPRLRDRAGRRPVEEGGRRRKMALLCMQEAAKSEEILSVSSIGIFHRHVTIDFRSTREPFFLLTNASTLDSWRHLSRLQQAMDRGDVRSLLEDDLTAHTDSYVATQAPARSSSWF